MSEPDSEAYAASKGGLIALTHALAISLGPQVRVNCISPGWIDVSGWHKEGVAGQESISEADHQQHPVGRVGTPEDVAALALFLGSRESAFVTGQNFVLDGGMIRKMIYV
jgi:NAD(P)-dependent dehydrogenase (short-subunit alcohol dehydrogenase family)